MSDKLRINKAYAENYNKWRQKEELQKLKDKYGDVENSESESSSSESEDENAEALSSQIEKDWLKTLAALKSKDPKIYNKTFQFYHDDKDDETSKGAVKKKDKTTPLYIKDYERKVILEKEGKLSDEDDSLDDSDDEEAKKRLGYYEQQEEIKKSIKAALTDSDESCDTELFTKRTKSKPEQEKEDEDYLEWLKGQSSNLDKGKQVGIELEPLKVYWNDPKLDDGEKFLRDYILNKGYLEQDSERIPTYDEIVDDGDGLSDDEEILVKQEEFERKYNFRFEEPDQDFIKTFPRQIEDSVRLKVSKRAEKRKEVKERKKLEKEKKKEEIKQLKNLKKKEILSKIDQLKEITGNPSLGFNEGDLEEDFDPKKHDEMMKKYFDEDYYGMEAEDQKPEIPDDLDDLKEENWDDWGGTEVDDKNDEEEEPEQDLYVDDPDFNMDADYDPGEGTSKKKWKKKSKFAQAVEKKKPVFDPKQKSFEQYFDEYYKLDYEDIVGDTPCRFKYRKVIPNNFGLEVNEILKCRDKELNAWVSLKKMSQFRTEEEEKMDVKIYQKKGKNDKKKQNVLMTLREESEKKKKIVEKKQNKEQERELEMSDSPKKKKKKSTGTDQHLQAGSISQKSQKRGNSSASESEYSPVKKMKLDTESCDLKELDNKRKQNVENALDSEKTDDTAGPIVTVATPAVTNEEKGVKKKRKRKRKQKVANSSVSIEGVSQMTDKNMTGGVSSVSVMAVDSAGASLTSSNQTDDTVSKKKRKKKKKKGLPKLSDERLLAYGINPKKLKYLKTDNYKGQSKSS